jgi:hypothetical protein
VNATAIPGLQKVEQDAIGTSTSGENAKLDVKKLLKNGGGLCMEEIVSLQVSTTVSLSRISSPDNKDDS